MAVAIMQPYFFPYLGYFQLVQAAEHFVFYDDVMFIKKGWINRNRILMQGKEFLFTIPLEKQSQNKTIRESTVSFGKEFPKKLMQQIDSAYKKAPFFESVRYLMEEVLSCESNSMADLAAISVIETWKYLNLSNRFYFSSQLKTKNDLGRAERLISITQELSQSQYINAINGQNLYDKPFFNSQGVDLKFLQPTLNKYPQKIDNQFVIGLSMIDVLMWNSPTQIQKMLVDYQLV